MTPCPTCGFDNPPDSSHCERCGRPLGGIRSVGIAGIVGLDGESTTPPDPLASEETGAAPDASDEPRRRRGRRGKRGSTTTREAGELHQAGKVESDNALGEVERVALKLDMALTPKLGGKPAGVGDSALDLQSSDMHASTLRVRDPLKRRTIHEGLPAVIAVPSPETLWPTPASLESVTAPPPLVPEGHVPAPPAGADAEEAETPPPEAARPAVRNAARTQALPAIDVAALGRPGTPPPPFQIPYPSAPSTTVTIQRRTDASAAFFGGVFSAVLFVGAVFAVHQLATRADDAPTSPAEVPTGRVLIEAGPFLRGLSNDFRVMFSNTCPKLADNPAVECKEDVGLREEIPMTTVELPAYAIDRHEVGIAQWLACEQAGGCTSIQWDECENRTAQGYAPFLRVPKALRGPERPVICVTQAEAAAFCAWSGGRLPGADEWEKAARGKDAYLFPWGSDWSAELANWGEQDVTRTNVPGKLDGFLDPAPPGSFPEGKSPFGCYDMAGNVAEWVRRKEDTELEATARGGSWLSTPDDLRTTRRLFVKPDTRRTDIGFRCAADP